MVACLQNSFSCVFQMCRTTSYLYDSSRCLRKKREWAYYTNWNEKYSAIQYTSSIYTHQSDLILFFFITQVNFVDISLTDYSSCAVICTLSDPFTSSISWNRPQQGHCWPDIIWMVGHSHHSSDTETVECISRNRNFKPQCHCWGENNQ